MNEWCSMMSNGGPENDQLASVWTNGDLNKLVLIHCWLINEDKSEKGLTFCKPSRDNKYRWNAFLYANSSTLRKDQWEEGKKLCKEINTKFF